MSDIYTLSKEEVDITNLSQSMLPREAWTTITLHQSSGLTSIWSGGCFDADIATTFLHDHAENDALVDSDLSCLTDGVKYAANIFASVARLEHGWFEDVEQVYPVADPGVHARKVERAAAV